MPLAFLFMSVSIYLMIKKLNSRIVYQNKWMKVREDDVEFADGTKGIYSVLEKPEAALIIPKLNDDAYVLVRTYRYTTGKTLWEFPCGGVEDTQMDHQAIAHRELQEETGYLAKNMRRLASLHVSYGYSAQIMHIYLAEDLTPGKPNHDPGEVDMEMNVFSATEIESMMISGQITDSLSVSAWGMMRMQEKQ